MLSTFFPRALPSATMVEAVGLQRKRLAGTLAPPAFASLRRGKPAMLSITRMRRSRRMRMILL
jgi:hypothetical protein